MGVLNVYFSAKNLYFSVKIDVFFHFYFNFLYVFGTKDTHSG